MILAGDYGLRDDSRRVTQAASGERVVVIAPHPDDETIAAAAYAFDALRAGADVSVVFVTAGDAARFAAHVLHRTGVPGPRHFANVGRTRIAEARTTMRLLGLPPDRVFFLGYPDGSLAHMLRDERQVVRSETTSFDHVSYDEAVSPGAPYNAKSIVDDLQRIFNITNPTTVVAPVPFDLHSDHSASSELVDRALSLADRRVKRLGYVVHTARWIKAYVWTPERALLPPPHLRSLSWAMYPVSPEAQLLKQTILKAYKSQRPYTFLLRNAFVRSNELFFPVHAVAPAPVRLAPSFACASYSSPSSL